MKKRIPVTAVCCSPVTGGVLDREQRGKWAWFRIRPECFAAIRAALGEAPAAPAAD